MQFTCGGESFTRERRQWEVFDAVQINSLLRASYLFIGCYQAGDYLVDYNFSCIFIDEFRARN